ncbi:MAG: fibronectin type III domain-containing protein, partial [Sulfurovaceae bacterium]|nr:fibronectin type III domain-containing protein [Sulfurovaceae bacterium]
MFIKKRLFVGLLATVGMFSFADATAVLNAPGPYVGATMIDNSSVEINTADNSNNEDGFYVSIYKYPSLTLFDTVEVEGSDSSQVEATVTGLTCDQTYKAVVVAYNTDGNSSASDDRYFNMKSTFGASCPQQAIPNAPGPYLGVTDINKTAVRVNFLDNSDNETGFKISGDGINETVSANDETVHPYVYKTIDGLTCDKLYKIKAVAYNTSGDSNSSDLRDFNISSTFDISCDGDNDPLTYKWTIINKPNGSNASLSDDTLVNPTFVVDEYGAYTLQLIVNDGTENSIADTVTITASVINSHHLDVCDQWSV